MITNEEKIKFYDMLEKATREFLGGTEDIETTISDASWDFPRDAEFLEDLLWYFAFMCYGIETPWTNRFLEGKH